VKNADLQIAGATWKRSSKNCLPLADGASRQ
jgi:hypothetical protein